VKAVAERVAKAFKADYVDARMVTRIKLANRRRERMTWEEKRQLCELVFGGKGQDGRRLGVRVSWVEGQEQRKRKAFAFRISGKLIDSSGTTTDTSHDDEPTGAPLQGRLLEEVTRKALHSQGRGLLARRFCEGIRAPSA
jgi:hypothetical protein